MINNLACRDMISESDNIGFEFCLDLNTDPEDTMSEPDVYSFSVNLKYDSILKSILDHLLKKDLEIEIIQEGEYWFVNSKDLCIFESGMSYFEALMSFSSFFLSDMDFYNDSPDEELADDAIELKKKYLSYYS